MSIKLKRSDYLILLPIIVAGGLVGFFGSLALLRDAPSGPTYVVASLRADTGWIAELGPGWGKLTQQGTPIIASTASLSLPLPAKPVGDIVLDIERATPQARITGEFEVRVNDTMLGRWNVASIAVKRVLLPQSLAASRNQLSLVLTGHDLDGPIIIRQIIARDVTALPDVIGSIDNCRNSTIAGWTRAGLAPAPVVLRRNGVQVATVMPSIERPDLPGAGLPHDAAFEIHLDPPPAKGEAIEVVLPNGQRLKVACES